MSIMIESEVGAGKPVMRLIHSTGLSVEGEALVSTEGFSPRYDLDRWSGEITKIGHKLQGKNIRQKICFFPTAKGGIAAGWAFADLQGKGLAPNAFIFGTANPVMVQGAIHAGITLAEGWDVDPGTVLRTGDWVRVDTRSNLILLVRRLVGNPISPS